MERDGEHVWSKDQKAVIEGPVDAWVMVDAGPGSGKTDVACARIAYLIDNCGVAASSIHMTTFTRTAVGELRNRISKYMQDQNDAHSINISTLDSLGARIRRGFEGPNQTWVGYDEGIDDLSEILAHPSPGLEDYLSQWSHLFIDEAQDIVDKRLVAIMHLLDILKDKGCGLTIFSDEAQAIYTFTADESENPNGGGMSLSVGETLPMAVRQDRFFSERIHSIELHENYRTDDEGLISIAQRGRSLIKEASLGSGNVYSDVYGLINEFSHEQIGIISEIKDRQDLDNTLILFRTRAEVLAASDYFGDRPRRLRLPALPAVIPPWIAQVLWDWTEPILGKSNFMKRWNSRVVSDSLGSEGAWAILVSIAGESDLSVSMSTLTNILARRSPPEQVVISEFGYSGPILGTIHASKGRESEKVLLYLPPGSRDSKDEEGSAEESRVIFVGATRARKSLGIGQGAKTRASQVQGGRKFSPRSSRGSTKAARIEFGRSGDVNAESLCGRKYFQNLGLAKDAQADLLRHGSSIKRLTAQRGSGEPWGYGITFDSLVGRPPFAYFSAQVNSDLFSVGENLGLSRKSPKTIKHLTNLGLMTVVIGPDDPARELLLPPWNKSGLMLGPLVVGFPTVYF